MILTADELVAPGVNGPGWLQVAVERGGDPDAPRGLAKVTETL